MSDEKKNNKNLVQCKSCGKDIAKGVKTCPHCGKDQRNFFMRHKILTGILVLIVIGFIGAMAGGSDDDPVDEGPKVVETEETEEVEKQDDEEETEETVEEDNAEDLEDQVFEIGEVVETDGQTVEVTDVEKSSGSDFDKPKEGNEYVIVHVAIENNGEDEISYNPYNFKMKNSNGQIESSGFITVDSDTSLTAGDLAPDGNVSGTIAFEQPIDDEGLQLIFEPGFWDDIQLVFNLS